MSKSRVTCPECDAQLALGPTVSAGQRIRCPKCETVFAVPEPAPPAVRDRPRPVRRFKPKKQSSSAGVLAAIIAASVLLVAGVAVGGYLLWKSPKAGLAKKDVVPPAGIGTNVGQLVKEVEGQDIDGVAFKLSDYRGKVVVLDFWGHW